MRESTSTLPGNLAAQDALRFFSFPFVEPAIMSSCHLEKDKKGHEHISQSLTSLLQPTKPKIKNLETDAFECFFCHAVHESKHALCTLRYLNSKLMWNLCNFLDDHLWNRQPGLCLMSPALYSVS